MTAEKLRQSILETLAYASVFDYPLTPHELYQRLISSESPGTFASFKKQLAKILEVQQLDGYLYLNKHTELVHHRRQREAWSKQLEKEVLPIVRILRQNPNITHIYITGSLAMQNVQAPDDDIDLLIVTRPHTLWLTRLWVIWQTTRIGKYRLHGDKGGGWCFNLWLTLDSLLIPSSKRSVYTAYEVTQARLVYGQDNALLAANPWVKDYLIHTEIQQTKKSRELIPVVWWQRTLDLGAFWLQYLYMSPRKTIEHVGREVAFFHPRDTQGWIIKKFHQILDHYV